MNNPTIQTNPEIANRQIENEKNESVINKNSALVYKAALCWAFMFGLGESNFGLFADHLKAPLSFYAALIWVPGLIGPLIQILAANILDRFGGRVKMCYYSVYIQALSFIPLFIVAFWAPELDQLVPLQFTSFSNIIFISAVTIYYLSGSYAGPPWQSFIGDLVKPEQRGNFFANISKINSIYTLICFLVGGYALFVADNYFSDSFFAVSIVFLVFFSISLIARLFSGRFIQNMVEMPYQSNASSVFTFWQFIKRAHESNFVKFVIFVSVLNCGMNIAGPYYLPFWTATLNYSKSQWIIFTCVGTLASIITFMAWGRFSNLFGNKKTIKYCSFLIALIPFGWFISTNFYYLLLLQIIGSIFVTGFALSTLNYIYEAASSLKRARCFAYFGVITGVGTYIGTQIGLYISNHFPAEFLGLHFSSTFYWVLIFSGIVRLLACFIFIPFFKELRDVKPFEMESFWYDVLQLHTILGKPKDKKKET